MLRDGGTGVTTYARGLHAAQAALCDRPVLLEDGGGGARARRWVLAARPGPARAITGPDDAGVERWLARDVFRIAHVHFRIHGRLLRIRAPGPPGVMHWTYPVPLAIAGWANVYTVHDAIPLTAPGLTPIDPVRHRRLLGRIAAEAAALVTVSAAARAEIAGALGCSPGFVADCGQAVTTPPPPPGAALPAGLARGGYLLVCGSVEPRKNIARIAAAWRQAGAPLPLVIAGPDGWRAPALAPAIDGAPAAIRIPFLPRGELLALIAGARALLMPSLAEGFGLPVAEAMALGVPVLTSAGGALAEIAGGAALLADPWDVADIAGGIARLCRDDAFAARLAAAGPVAAARFSPDRFADRLAAFYDRLIAGWPPPA